MSHFDKGPRVAPRSTAPSRCSRRSLSRELVRMGRGRKTTRRQAWYFSWLLRLVGALRIMKPQDFHWNCRDLLQDISLLGVRTQSSGRPSFEARERGRGDPSRLRRLGRGRATGPASCPRVRQAGGPPLLRCRAQGTRRAALPEASCPQLFFTTTEGPGQRGSRTGLGFPMANATPGTRPRGYRYRDK